MFDMFSSLQNILLNRFLSKIVNCYCADCVAERCKELGKPVPIVVAAPRIYKPADIDASEYTCLCRGCIPDSSKQVRKDDNVNIIKFDELNTEDWKCLCAWCVFEKKPTYICSCKFLLTREDISAEFNCNILDKCHYDKEINSIADCVRDMGENYNIHKNSNLDSTLSVVEYMIERVIKEIDILKDVINNKYDMRGKEKDVLGTMIPDRINEYRAYQSLKFALSQKPLFDDCEVIDGNLYHNGVMVSDGSTLKSKYKLDDSVLKNFLYYGVYGNEYLSVDDDKYLIIRVYKSRIATYDDVERSFNRTKLIDDTLKGKKDELEKYKADKGRYEEYLKKLKDRISEIAARENHPRPYTNEPPTDVQATFDWSPTQKTAGGMQQIQYFRDADKQDPAKLSADERAAYYRAIDSYCYECNKYKGACIGHTAEPEELASAKKMNALTTRVIQLERELREIKTLLSAMISPQCTAM
jgi:hypothetical protein